MSRSSARMVMVVETPDAAFAQAVAAGAVVIWPVADQPYGWRVDRRSLRTSEWNSTLGAEHVDGETAAERNRNVRKAS